LFGMHFSQSKNARLLNFYNVSKSIFILVKSFLGNFYRHLAIFSGLTGPVPGLGKIGGYYPVERERTEYNIYAVNEALTTAVVSRTLVGNVLLWTTFSIVLYIHGAFIRPWSSLVKEESLACQITSPFNNKLGVFENKIKKIALQSQPIFLLSG